MFFLDRLELFFISNNVVILRIVHDLPFPGNVKELTAVLFNMGEANSYYASTI